MHTNLLSIVEICGIVLVFYLSWSGTFLQVSELFLAKLSLSRRFEKIISFLTVDSE